MLTTWLADREPEPTRLESETLGRLFFSEYGTVDDLRAAAIAVVGDGAAVLEVVQRRSRVYLGQGTEFPQRVRTIAIAGRLLADHGLMPTRYGSGVLEVAATWADTAADGKAPAALEIFEVIERESTAELARIAPLLEP